MISLFLASFLAASTSGVWVVDQHVDLPVEMAAALRSQSLTLVQKSGLAVVHGASGLQAPDEACLANPSCLKNSLQELKNGISEADTTLLHIQALRVGDKVALVCRLHNALGGVVAQDESWVPLAQQETTILLSCPQSEARLASLGQAFRVANREKSAALSIQRTTNARAIVSNASAGAISIRTNTESQALNQWFIGGVALSTMLLGGGTAIALTQNALRIDPYADGDKRAESSMWIPVGAATAAVGALGMVTSLVVMMFSQVAENEEAQ